MEFKLRPYQKEGVSLLNTIIHKYGAAYLADEMGLGKTAQAAYLARLLEMGIKNREPLLGAKRVLVICPAPLRLNWARELKTWAPELDQAFCVLKTTDAKHLAKQSVVVTSYDLTVREAVLTELLETSWDYIIFDESHYLKNRDSKRTKVCLGKIYANAKYRLFLSGTPLPNGVVDGFTVFNKIHPQMFPNFYKFAERYAHKIVNHFGVKYIGGKNLPELASKVRGSFLVIRKKKDVLRELPDKIYSKVPLSLSKKEIAEFKLTEEDEKAFEDAIREGRELVVSEHMATVRRGTGLLKAPHAARYIDEVFEGKNRLVVFAHHTGVIQALQEHLSGGYWQKVSVIKGGVNPILRQEIIDNFQNLSNRTPHLLIGQIQAAGVGITLTAADTCVFVEMPWTAAELGQAIDRLHRIGQKAVVGVHYLLAEGTIDTHIVRALTSKIRVVNEVLGGEAA